MSGLLKKLFGTDSQDDEYIVEADERVLDGDVETSDGGVPSSDLEHVAQDEEGELSLDMYDSGDSLVIKSTIAGVRPEDVDITVADDVVLIKGQRKREDRVSAKDYFYQECYWGEFSRSVRLPIEVDTDKTEAEIKDGVLTIILPKLAEGRRKKVKVRGS